MLTESPGMAPARAIENRPGFSVRYSTLLVLFALETLAINLARLPESMRFDRFAFCDHGANLTLQYLIANGLRPSVDFGYHYGLLPALVGRIWFGLFGATPWAYQAAMVVADLLCAWAITKILSQLTVGTVGIALAVITLGYSFQATYINFAHAIEAVLLSQALAEQARGSRTKALAFASAAVFAKPSMGYVYGLLLVALIFRDLRRSGFSFRRLLTELAPAAFVFLGLATVVSLTYGPQTFLHTVLPIEGVSNYRALNFGLMAAGRGLWDPKGLPWIFYFIDVSGFWIAGTLFLFGSTLLRPGNRDGEQLSNRRAELTLTCAILHLAFLLLFFGNQWSWIYYSYFLMIGVTLACELGPAPRLIGLGLCAIALLSWTDVAYWSHRWWQTTAPDTLTAGLWAPADEREEWLRVLSTARGHQTAILDTMGAAELLYPGFEDPVSLYLTRGLMLPEDVHRKLNRLSRAEIVVVPITITACSGIPDAPEFASELKNFDPVWIGKHFEIFQRHAVR
jgi:hypothetical protein